MFIPSTPNLITQAADFYVSYNPVDVSIYGDVTTALVVGQMERFYILNGDHQAAYRDLIPQGFNACLDYFIEHIGEMNHRSDRPEALVNG